jgi:hypothetical protein
MAEKKRIKDGKRLPKGQRTHNRRVKQAAHKSVTSAG